MTDREEGERERERERERATPRTTVMLVVRAHTHQTFGKSSTNINLGFTILSCDTSPAYIIGGTG